MYVQERRDRDGNVYFSFSYVDETGKRVRLKKAEHPLFRNFEDAEAWAASQSAIHTARQARHARKVAWRTAYYKFEDLKDLYAKWQREKAPNSWRRYVADLENFVFAFFLTKKQAGNINTWHLFHQDFVDWLRDEAVTLGSNPRKIARGTGNNIVRALNTFMTCMLRYNKADPETVVKCPAFPDHQLNRRGFADVILEEERDRVYAEMRELDAPAADFFYVLWHTGMRFSELFGLPITALFKGDIRSKPLQDELTKNQISYVGWLYLESQPQHDDRRRETDGRILRKPLKGNKEISPKYARSIPIRSKEVWNILARRYKEQKAALARRAHGTDEGDYVFFEDLEWNRAVNTLREAYKALGMKPKGYHSCRHSFTTLLAGETRSFFLVRAITGHRKDASFERYLHIFEQIALAAQQAEQDIEEIA